MKTTTTWNCGNFTLTHGADIAENLIPAMLETALLHVMQRNTGIDKALGIVKTVNGKPVRSKLKRVDVAFSDDIVQALSDALDSFTVKIGEKEIKVDVATGVERYDREAGGAYKFTREIARFAALESSPTDSIEKWLAAKELLAGNRKFVNLPVYVGPTHGDDGEYHPDALRAAREKFAAADAQVEHI